MSVDLRVDWCDHKAAKYAVEHWHYSKTMPTPPVVKIGVWEGDSYIGCVLFSRGATTNYGKAYGIRMTEIAELTRVALKRHESSVSKILAKSIELLRKKEKGLRLLISFADTNQNHLGVIYQAGNWIYTGDTGQSSKFQDKSGRVWHSRQVSRTGVSRQYGELRHVPKIEDCKRITEEKKHRYLYPLDRAMRKQIEPLRKPYPKRETCGPSVEGDTPSQTESSVRSAGAASEIGS
jgi:hypothetical protein